MRIAAIESLTDSELGYSAIYTKPAGDVEPEECPFFNSPCPARLIIDLDENAVLFYLFVPAGNSSFEDPIPEPGELKTRKKSVQIAGGLISVRHVIFSSWPPPRPEGRLIGALYPRPSGQGSWG
ncbi:MAG: hypothetical protein ACP5I3_12145, partial [Thermoproteus sp.]